ncbi:glycerophosphodiester phosphodiesterase [Lentiprolixibacter aurantiacus]|uniref:Glycerophosphodiester phosphodiesterase n=1 Tax=Lentiprolixibacter aurantiacus TaxID=2993939 RepID=A0AAE3MJS9_9FLAO|nr:glycerophosphodiester phosphodiesterase [Lentiprolixibacter aurantiacus]MCX2718164.1 glycerophosphodiester phosphodiesterase [Lentiprolixibacter aurantiacus]
MRKLSLIFILFFLVACNSMGQDYLVIGHRGAKGHEMENSLPSVQKALDLGVDMIEIDVFRIKSGEIVVFHDKKLKRLTNASGYIEEFNLTDLRKVELKGGHEIPLLADVISLIDKKADLNIELKGAGTAEQVNHIMSYFVEDHGWTWDNFVISSFNWDELREMRKLNLEVPIAVLTESDPLKAIPMAQELRAVAINPNYRRLNASNIEEMHKAGFKIYTWTVNDQESIQNLIELGVDGIISDYPERVPR